MKNKIGIKNHVGTVLVVDDAKIMRSVCERALVAVGYNVITAQSGEEALNFLKNRLVDVTVSDIRMPGTSGIDLLREIRLHWPLTKVIMMTAYADAEVAEESLNLGATTLLIKPFKNIKILVQAVNKSMAIVNLVKGEWPDDGPPLEEILLHSKLVDDEQLKEAQTLALEQGITLHKALSTLNIIAADELRNAVANYLDVSYVRLNENMIDHNLIRNFPANIAHTYTCLPLFKSGDELHLVIGNPYNQEATRAIGKALQVNPFLSMGYEPEIRNLINRFYGTSPRERVKEIMDKLQVEKAVDSEKLIQEFFDTVLLETLTNFKVNLMGPDLFELQMSANIRLPE